MSPLGCCSNWEAGVSSNAKSDCDEGVPASGRANVHRGRRRHGAFGRENAPSWTRPPPGNPGQTRNLRPLEPFTPHDQNKELIRTNGEGGAKHSWEDARQFVLINVAEGTSGGSVRRGTMVEPLLPWFLRGLVSACVWKAIRGGGGASCRPTYLQYFTCLVKYTSFFNR